MSAYEELLDAVAAEVAGYDRDYETSQDVAALILAEVLRTLETVTPEMWDALPPRALDFDEAYLAMLRASALNPGAK